MDSLKIINDLISEKMKRNLSMVEFHKRQVEKYESIIQELDELRDDLEFELDCEDQNYRYNNQTERFEKISPMKEYKNTFRSLTSLGEEDCDDDDYEIDGDDDWKKQVSDIRNQLQEIEDRLSETKSELKELKLYSTCPNCKKGVILSFVDKERGKFICSHCDYN